MSDNFPKSMLENIYWSFGGKVFDSRAEFDEEIRQRQIDIGGKDTWEPEKIVLLSANIRLVYEFWEGAVQGNKVVEISADNGESFTAGELLFKIHNLVTEDLREMDRRFFEGLNLKSPPKYWLMVGS